MIPVYVSHVGVKHRVNLTLVRHLGGLILAQEGWAWGFLSLKVCDHKTIHHINRTYLNHNYPTDVISFAMLEGERHPGDDERYVGDCVVSMDMAFDRAQEFGHTPDQELALYMIHGILHLLGYNDVDSKDRKLMRHKEAYYMEQIQDKLKKEGLIRGS